jgi:hypothetical protein
MPTGCRLATLPYSTSPPEPGGSARTGSGESERGPLRAGGAGAGAACLGPDGGVGMAPSGVAITFGRTRGGDGVEVPDYRRLDGVEVTNQDGEKLGRVDGLFVDDQVNVPTWVAVGSGIFGSHHSLVPLAQTRFVDGRCSSRIPGTT